MNIWATSWQNQLNDLCARPVWSEFSLSIWRNIWSSATHWVHCEDWSDWADSQADLSLRWEQRPFCWFCHEVVQFSAPIIGDIPWENQSSEAIRAHYSKGNSLKLYQAKIPEFYKVFMEYGLELDPNKRKLSFLHVRDLLQTAPKVCDLYKFCPKSSWTAFKVSLPIIRLSWNSTRCYFLI